MIAALVEKINGAAVVRLAGAFHDAFNFTELAAHFLHDSARRATDGFHRHRGEQERHETANEQADNDQVIIQQKDGIDTGLVERVGVVREQHESRETGRTDSVAFGDSLGRITDSIQLVSNVANFRRQFSHLGDTAGVIGDWPESIQCDHDARHRQHGRCSNCDVVKTREVVARRGQCERAPDARAHRQYRQCRRFHRNTETGDDVGRVTGQRGFGDRLDRFEIRTRVVLGNYDHRGGQREADQRGKVDARNVATAAHHHIGDKPESDCREYARHDHALVQGAHDLAAVGGLDKERADNRGNDRNRAENQREHHGLGTEIDGDQAAEQHRCNDRNRVGFEQVGCHTGAVAHVVAHVIGNNARVARVVFRNTGFDLADKVGTDVSTLGEDTASPSRAKIDISEPPNARPTSA